MTDFIWGRLSKLSEANKSRPRIQAMPKYSEASLDHAVARLRKGFEASSALCFEDPKTLTAQFLPIAANLFERVAGREIKNDFSQSLKDEPLSEHFAELQSIAASFYLINEPIVACLGGHAVVWNEAATYKARLGVKTVYDTPKPKPDFLEAGAYRRIPSFQTTQHPVRFSPHNLNWAGAFYSEEPDPLLFTRYESRRTSKFPGSPVTLSADLSVFHKGCQRVRTDGQPSKISAPMHSLAVRQTANQAVEDVESALFFDALHLELTRFRFCSICHNAGFPSVTRESLYLAFHLRDYFILYLVFASLPMLVSEASSLSFSNSTYGRWLGQG